MTIPQDFREFLELLNEHKVRYLIVGGYAVGFHSRPKFTEDIDIWVECEEFNAKKLISVLQEFGFGDLDISIEDLTNPEMVIQLGRAPLRIDIMTGVSGLKFADCFPRGVPTKYFGLDVKIIAINDLITNKKASGRKKDILDIEWIKQYSKKG